MDNEKEKEVDFTVNVSKREDALIYKPENYEVSIVVDCKPSKECKEYHENSYIRININGKNVIKRCGALNTDNT